jgi:hypothetical protein
MSDDESGKGAGTAPSMDGSSSSDESTEELRQIFDAIDTDRDGFITLEEMMEKELQQSMVRGSIFNENRKRAELQEFIRAGDLNGDQQLDFREFVISMNMRALHGQQVSSDEDDGRQRSASQVSLARRASQAKTAWRQRQSSRKLTKIRALNNSHWEKHKGEVMDPSAAGTRERLKVLFDSLGGPERGVIEVKSVVDNGRDFLHPAHLKALEERADKEVDLEEFGRLLQGAQVTNGELKDGSDAVVYFRVRRGDYRVESMSLEDVRCTLSAIRRRVPDGDADFDLALTLADLMADKADAAQREVTYLEEQLDRTTRHLRKAKAQIASLMQAKPSELAERAAKEAQAAKEAAQRRSHAERNQEFFFITALAVKLNVEARLKAAGQPLPPVPSTKKLYEEAMQAKVPFQLYYRWIERQLDPTMRKPSVVPTPALQQQLAAVAKAAAAAGAAPKP